MRVLQSELPRDPSKDTKKLEKRLHSMQLSAALDPLRVLRCAAAVEAGLSSAARGGKEVRWLFMSDNRWLRSEVEKHNPGRVLMVDAPPEHVSKIDIGVDQLTADMGAFAEWYLLSLADEFVLNRIQGSQPLYGPRDDGSGKHGRLSAYAKTALAYGVRDEYYDAGTCERARLQFDGAYGDFASECASSTRQ